MEVTTVFILGFAVVIAAIMIVVVVGISRDNKKIASIKSLPGFESADVFVLGSNSIAMDQRTEKIQLGANNQTVTIGFRDLISVEVIEDGVSVTSANRGSQAGRAIVGAVIAGGVGAIVGGLSATTTTVGKGTIHLRIVSSNSSVPYISIPFISHPIDKNTPGYKSMREQALLWNGRLVSAIKKTERSSVTSDSKPQAGSSAKALSTELVRLAALKNQGLLSEDEFRRAKSRILDESSKG